MVFKVEEPFKVADLRIILLTLSFLPKSRVANSWYKKEGHFFCFHLFPLFKAICSKQGICGTTLLHEKGIPSSPFSHPNTNPNHTVKEFEHRPSKCHHTINTRLMVVATYKRKGKPVGILPSSLWQTRTCPGRACLDISKHPSWPKFGINSPEGHETFDSQTLRNRTDQTSLRCGQNVFDPTC